MIRLGQYSVGANARYVDLGPVRVWFSYATPVAFRLGGSRPIVRRNEWGPTTGRHLAAIDGLDPRSARISGDAFLASLLWLLGNGWADRMPFKVDA